MIWLKTSSVLQELIMVLLELFKESLVQGEAGTVV